MPLTSIVIPSYNNAKGLEKLLVSIRDQSIDQSELEILVADGGSTDATLDLAERFKVRLIAERCGNPEAAKAIALRNCSGEFILFLASDNILPGPDFIKQLLEPLQKHPNVSASYPLRYAHDPRASALNRYFALLGANDPVAWFLGKADRLSYLQPYWNKHSKAVMTYPKYTVVQFDPKHIPTLGDNGFLIRKKVLEIARISPDTFFHIDVNVDLISLGYTQYAIVKNSILHESADSLVSFFRKRYRYATSLLFQRSHKRRYFVYDPKHDKGKLLLFCLYTLSLVGPIITSVRGFMAKRDIAWFLHPIVCYAILATYVLAVCKQPKVLYAR